MMRPHMRQVRWPMAFRVLRISGNISFLTPDEWPAFMAYEKSVTTAFSGRRVIALCSYVLEDCTPEQKTEVLRAHGYAFEHHDQHWHVIPSGPRF